MFPSLRTWDVPGRLLPVVTLIDSAAPRPDDREERTMRSVMTAVLLWMLATGLATGCSRTKEDILEKSRGITVRADLERALGKPSDINKLGPVEQWTYKASNGTVVFLIVGDTVTLQAAVPDERKDKK